MELGEGMEHVEPMHIDYGCVDTQLCPENRKKSLVIWYHTFCSKYQIG